MVEITNIRAPDYAKPGDSVDVGVEVFVPESDEKRTDKVFVRVDGSNVNRPIIGWCGVQNTGEADIIDDSSVWRMGRTDSTSQARDGSFTMPRENVELSVQSGTFNDSDLEVPLNGWPNGCARVLDVVRSDDSMKKKVVSMLRGSWPSDTTLDRVEVIGGSVRSLKLVADFNVTAPVDVNANTEISIIDVADGSKVNEITSNVDLSGTNSVGRAATRSVEFNVESDSEIPENLRVCGSVKNASRAT